MAIAIYFHPQAMTAKQYDEAMARLDAIGESKPKGRTHHSVFGPEDHVMVYDVWDSQEDFDAFGQKLMPILTEMGIDPGQPDVMPIHRVVQ
jgi:heme-degrading monooxygenase HmoA